MTSTIVSRAEWGARKPRSRSTSISPRGSTMHWEGPKMGAFTHDRCAGKVRGIQAFHMDSRGWADIAYSALICPHGFIYEGRWLGTRTAANGTNEGNASHYAICYLGGDGDPFTEQAKTAFKDCISYFDSKGAGSEIKTHREWKSTMCAGPLIQTWKNAGCPTKSPTPTPSEGVTVHSPPLQLTVVADLVAPGGGAWLLTSNGAIYAFGKAEYLGACNGKTYFAGRTAKTLHATGDGRYVIEATTGEKYGPDF